ncbi:MAG: RidA family protein [Pseudomonadota bacterium]
MIHRIHSGGDYEPKVGYCRAVVAGGWVHVAGTVGDGKTAVEQCRSALEIIRRALEKAGTDFAHVVRVTYILPDRNDFPACWPYLRAAFGDNPPAATMIESGLITPEDRIEIEVTAILPD